MNFDLLSKNAVSYSSASMTKYPELVRATDLKLPFGDPPIK